MTTEDKKIMDAILRRILSHEIDNQKMWLKNSIDKYGDTPEMVEKFTSERNDIIRIVSEFMDENNIAYDPLAYMGYE